MRYIVGKENLEYKTGVGISCFDFQPYACLAASPENSPALDTVHDLMDVPQGLNLVFYDLEALERLTGELEALKRQFRIKLEEWQASVAEEED